MDIFCKSCHIQQHLLYHLNYYCMYLQITHLSDITTSNGKHVRDEILNCTFLCRLKCQQNLDCPNLSCPDKWTWKLWQKSLTETICNEKGKLHEALGMWTRNEVQWNWKYHEGYLYQCNNDTWTCAKVTKKDCQLYNATNPFLPSTIPTITQPVMDAAKHATMVTFTPPRELKTRQEPKMNQSTMFQELVTSLLIWEKELLQYVEYHLDEEELFHIITNDNKLYFVSDGGKLEGLG
eukprot:466981-Ditylum_brightwellii.AAC.2